MGEVEYRRVCYYKKVRKVRKTRTMKNERRRTGQQTVRIRQRSLLTLLEDCASLGSDGIGNSQTH